MNDAMTVDVAALLSARRMVEPSAWMGLRIVFTTNALESTGERLFPFSPHRSARVRKKLIRRFGGEFRHRPCMWRVGDTLFAHPSYRAALEDALTP